MMRCLLLFTLALSTVSAFAVRMPTQKLIDERETLLHLQDRFTRFIDTVNETDEKFRALRAAAYDESRESYVLADELTRMVTNSRRRWRDLESAFDEAAKKRVDLNRPTQSRSIVFTPGFSFYLAFRKHNRYGNGTPMEFLINSWRGITIGKKLEKLPANLEPRGSIARFPIRSGDSILFMTTNGGLIRGRFEGMSGNQFVIREVLPLAMVRHQSINGMYRSLNLNLVARVEVIRRPPTISAQEAPPAVISVDGTYSSYYVQKDYIWRIRLQPSDVELLDLTKNRRLADARFSPIATPVDPEFDERPAFTTFFFSSCEVLLGK